MGLKYLLLVFSFCVTLSYQEQEKVKVSVYYEALCRDSMDFILDQLYPTYWELRRYIILDFVPFGKAAHSFSNGRWQFVCQHGQSECHANKIHSLFLNQDLPDYKKMNFVHCMMSASYKQTLLTAQVCSNKIEEPWSWTSSFHLMADQLLANNGDRTQRVFGSMTFVPMIVFNDQFNKNLHWSAFKDLKGTLCNYLGNKPRECTKYNKY